MLTHRFSGDAKGARVYARSATSPVFTKVEEFSFSKDTVEKQLPFSRRHSKSYGLWVGVFSGLLPRVSALNRDRVCVCSEYRRNGPTESHALGDAGGRSFFTVDIWAFCGLTRFVVVLRDRCGEQQSSHPGWAQPPRRRRWLPPLPEISDSRPRSALHTAISFGDDGDQGDRASAAFTEPECTR
jgi:hypothetical protein